MRFEREWVNAEIRAIADVTAEVRQFDIVPEDGCRAYTPGSHLHVQVEESSAHGVVPGTRSYSLIGEAAHDGAYRIAVRRQAQSRGGSRYLWSLRVGARLRMAHPQNLFELTHGRPEYLLLAGGIGITPLIGMAAALSAAHANFRLLFLGRNPDGMPYVDALRALHGDRVKTLCSESGERLDVAEEIAALQKDALLYVCGPMRLLDEVRRAWETSGRPRANLRFETFGSSGSFSTQSFVVKVVDRDLDVMVAESQTMLQALKESGVPVMFDCLRGECGLCAVDVVSYTGEMDHRDVFFSADERCEVRKICACVSRVAQGYSADAPTIMVDTGFRG